MIIIRIIKKPYLDLMIEKLLKIGYKKDIIHSLTSKANYIYMTERKTHPSECGWDVSDH